MMPSGFGKNTFRSVKQKCVDGFRALDPKLKILAGVAIVWGLLIWATSGTVVTVPQLATAVTSVLPIERAQFLAFWERSWWLFVKGWHATEFGLLYAVMHTVIRRFKIRFNPAFGLALTWAFLDEYHQTFVKFRGGQLSDVVIDAIGITVACLLIDWRKDGKKIPPLRVIALLALAITLIGAIALNPFGKFPTPSQ